MWGGNREQEAVQILHLWGAEKKRHSYNDCLAKNKLIHYCCCCCSCVQSVFWVFFFGWFLRSLLYYFVLPCSAENNELGAVSALVIHPLATFDALHRKLQNLSTDDLLPSYFFKYSILMVGVFLQSLDHPVRCRQDTTAGVK